MEINNIVENNSIQQFESQLKNVEEALLKILSWQIDKRDDNYIMENGEYDFEQLIEDELESAEDHYQFYGYEDLDAVLDAIDEGEIVDSELEDLIYLRDQHYHLVNMIEDMKAQSGDGH